MAAMPIYLDAKVAHLFPLSGAREMYEPVAPPEAPEPGYIPSKRSLRTRLEHWISSHHH